MLGQSSQQLNLSNTNTYRLNLHNFISSDTKRQFVEPFTIFQEVYRHYNASHHYINIPFIFKHITANQQLIKKKFSFW